MDFQLHPKQRPPAGDWAYWHLTSEDRASGKSFGAAAWIRERALESVRCLIVIDEGHQARENLLAVLRAVFGDALTVGPGKVYLGDVPIQVTTVQAIIRNEIRGAQFGAVWCEDVERADGIGAALDQIGFALRLKPAQGVLSGRFAYPGVKVTPRSSPA